MSRSDHNRDILQGSSVDFALQWKSNKRVALALDFVSMKASIYHRQVNTRDTLAQSKFLYDERIWFPVVATTHLFTQSKANIYLPHDPQTLPSNSLQPNWACVSGGNQSSYPGQPIF